MTMQIFPLKWNKFQDSVNTAFGRLREDNDFTNVTLKALVWKTNPKFRGEIKNPTSCSNIVLESTSKEQREVLYKQMAPRSPLRAAPNDGMQMKIIARQ